MIIKGINRPIITGGMPSRINSHCQGSKPNQPCSMLRISPEIGEPIAFDNGCTMINMPRILVRYFSGKNTVK
ncbi:hypothetical protein D3C75_1144780 [compost metagenome]